MPSETPKGALAASRCVVVTDLDGSLLDQRTYSAEASRPAVRRLVRLGIPLVLCSSKTAAEIRRLWEKLELRDPFIVENGGAILIPPDYFSPPPGVDSGEGWRTVRLGKDIGELKEALAAAARHCRARVRSFGTMTLAEIAALTGLSVQESKRAAARFYDEPFIVDRGEENCVVRFLKARKFTVTRGDRFYHLAGGSDKGKATKALVGLYRAVKPDVYTIGIGNSANDLPLLASVDLPVLVRNPDGSWDREVERQIPAILKSAGIGPAGWREVVEKILAERIAAES
ncbi:MAG TPA: HAD-IIB family hydrolase [Candidatus Acidoferrales bacterium]|nr:HAD-IIB family hydrolase [Candidatus Acidoferrales bacterium]